MFKPAEAKALTDEFPFLLEYAYMWDKKSVVEFTDYVDANLKIPASSPIFPLSTDHTNSPKFVERTLKQFFASDSMAECILGEWHGKACLTSDFTPSVLRFIMFRGVDAMYPKPTTIVTSELKLARFMHKNGINIDMNEKELRFVICHSWLVPRRFHVDFGTETDVCCLLLVVQLKHDALALTKHAKD